MSWFSKPMAEGIKQGVTQGLVDTVPKIMAELVMEYRGKDLREIFRLRKENEYLRLKACIRDRGYCQCEACKALGAQTTEGEAKEGTP